jgi:hypothetical protein
MQSSADVIQTCSDWMLPACRQDETIIEEITDIPHKQAAEYDAVDSQQPPHHQCVCGTCGMAYPGTHLQTFVAVRIVDCHSSVDEQWCSWTAAKEQQQALHLASNVQAGAISAADEAVKLYYDLIRLPLQVSGCQHDAQPITPVSMVLRATCLHFCSEIGLSHSCCWGILMSSRRLVATQALS